MVFGKVSYGKKDKKDIVEMDKAPIELRELRQLVDEAK